MKGAGWGVKKVKGKRIKRIRKKRVAQIARFLK